MTRNSKIALGAIAATLVFSLLALLGGCTHTPPSTNPVIARAQVAIQVLQRDQELQNAAIAANTFVPKALSDADAVAIVQFTGATATAIKTSPDGWVAVTKAAYQQLKLVLGTRVPPVLASVFALLDGLLAVVN